jgi:hypothetical protein
VAYLPYVRCVIRGTTETTQTWSTGFSVTNDGTATNSELFTWLTAIDGLVKTWLSGVIATNWWDSGTQYTVLDAYSYPAPGGAFALAGLASSGTIGANTGKAPTQLAAVYSLRSGRAGRTGRGRMYVPVTAANAFTGTGQLGVSFMTTASTQFKTFFDAVNTLSIGTAAAEVVVAGRDSGAGAPVTTLQLGSKLRTQRRRTDKVGQANNVVLPL